MTAPAVRASTGCDRWLSHSQQQLEHHRFHDRLISLIMYTYKHLDIRSFSNDAPSVRDRFAEFSDRLYG